MKFEALLAMGKSFGWLVLKISGSGFINKVMNKVFLNLLKDMTLQRLYVTRYVFFFFFFAGKGNAECLPFLLAGSRLAI